MLDEATLQGMARIANKGEPISKFDIMRALEIVEWLRTCGYELRPRFPTSPMIRMLDAKEWRESVEEPKYHHVTIGYNITTEAGDIVEIAPFDSRHYDLGGYGSRG